ncbi:hypothetical protein BGI41_05885 [Methanobrevibacter sp. 87.7]|uniref:4Fe-4S double cluster binding domain-containing protein n=1 Tax=Methanobrevibacter sp. 87.7 TaxID=387957 RepID=UPI000B506724|nr:4Fe-4S double cluster binding domain-containing protein [Methanobrevibacter sp. 87.7]OWT32782.1 hypothetical protein BGI41_05885 [Methanobrevibacter sp. 87.7]
MINSLCGDCKLCVNACPGNAIIDSLDPKKSYNPKKCANFLINRKKEGHPFACGMCLYICPYGNKNTYNLKK